MIKLLKNHHCDWCGDWVWRTYKLTPDRLCKSCHPTINPLSKHTYRNTDPWYITTSLSGNYLTPYGWIVYCKKVGWEHLRYKITWELYRKHFYYSKNKLVQRIGTLLGHNSKL